MRPAIKGLIDLHAHTTASDGTLSPCELVRLAAESGLQAVAVTDHDTMNGVKEAMEEGRKTGVEVVAGVEIGVEFKTEMHILGYFFDDRCFRLNNTLEELKRNRNERNPKIVKKLKELGFDISIEEIVNEADGNVVGRPHIAKVLLKKGYVGSIQEAFDKYLSSGRPAYFEKDKLSPAVGIQKITEAGGIPVLAHPVFLNMSMERLDELLKELAASGLKGIEAYYTDHSADDTGRFLRLAIKYNLLATGGSDFHGSLKDDIRLGCGRGNLKVPYELLKCLKSAVI